MRIRYVFRDEIVRIDERKDDADASSWWVALKGSRNSQFFGFEKPDVAVGDAVVITIMRADAPPPQPAAIPVPVAPVAPSAPPVARVPEARELAMAEAPAELLFAEARARGYEGDPCNDCGNFTLVRNGTCLKCNTCGSTTGCS